MKIGAYHLSCFLLLALCFGAFNLAAYSQQDAVLAQGNPPLTQSRVDKVFDLLEWSLGVHLSTDQKSGLQRVLVRAWQTKNQGEIKSTLDIIDVHDALIQMSEAEREKARGQLQASILENLRKEPDDEMSRILASAYETAQSTNSNTTPQSNSSPTPVENKLRVGTDGFTGIYRMVRQKAININSNFPGSGYIIEYITFLPNGNVYWRLPPEGLLYFDPAVAQKAYPNDWGTYEIINGEIHILRGQEKRKYVITRNGERLNNPPSLGKGSFRPVPPADRLRLEGTYRLAADYPSITFTKDGNFRDEGFFPTTDAVRPDGTFYKRDTRGGVGTYLIEQNTLELHYSDGRTKRFPFIAFPEELAKKSALDYFILYYNDTFKRH